MNAITRQIGDKRAGMTKDVVWTQYRGAQGDLMGSREAGNSRVVEASATVGRQGSAQPGRSGT